MIEFARTKRRAIEINLTALIDIVFHLLVFVMLTTTFVISESMELSLPSGKAKSHAANVRVVRIEIATGGALFVDRQWMQGPALNQFLVDRLGNNPDEKIAIFTQAGVTVQQLIQVMDMVYLSGGRNIQVDRAS